MKKGPLYAVGMSVGIFSVGLMWLADLAFADADIKSQIVIKILIGLLLGIGVPTFFVLNDEKEKKVKK